MESMQDKNRANFDESSVIPGHCAPTGGDARRSIVVAVQFETRHARPDT